MSSDGFHVHGPHDHVIEHVAQGHGDHAAHDEGDGVSMNRIAMFTAILATVGAIFSYMGGATQANAGLFKNNAALEKAQASNQWNYFQAKSTKQSLSELARDLAPADKQAKYDDKIARYDKEKKDIQKDAEKHEAISKDWDKQSDEQMHQHHRWAQATTVLQVAIALAAIALLTRRKWLERAMYGVAFAGVVIGVLAALHI
jgi:Na+/glutamate symporter